MNNMNALEKILEEIKERIEKLNMADNMCRENAERNRNFESVKYFQSLMFATERAKSIIEDIIRSHMDDGKDINVSDKDGWVSAKERMLIYGCRGCWEPEEIEEMRLLEQALGIRLFAWQKTYIKNGNFRCFGKTTAVIIRILTQGKEPVDLRNYGTIQKYIAMDTPQIMAKSLCDFFKSEVKEIHEKLLAAGIKTNPVFYTETDKRNFYERKK